MGKTNDVVRSIVFIIGGVFVLQVPLFIALLKLAELKGYDNVLSSAAAAGQVLLLGSLNVTRPPLMAGIESIYSSPSHGSDCPLITASAPASQGQWSSGEAAYKPLSFANYPFVLFSVYRDTLRSFYVHGITSVIVRRYENEEPVYRCEWLPSSRDITNDNRRDSGAAKHGELLVTKARLLYVSFDENGMAYVPAIVNCTFNQTVGADGEGGVLRLHLSRGPSFWEPRYAVEDVFIEKPGVVNEKSLPWLTDSDDGESSQLDKELLYEYAFCGPPLYGKAQGESWIPRWLAYHHYIWQGKAHFYFYVAEALDATARRMLEPWIRAGLLTVVDGTGGEGYPSWYRNQLLFINDCIYRTRFTARWTFFLDLDELLHVPAPNTLAGLLEKHREKPWMTFGNLPFSTSLCRATGTQGQSSAPAEEAEEWHMERMRWRNPQPECMHDGEDPWMCVAAPGRRKFVVNPRKVFLAGVHRVALPDVGGVHFNASVARVHHFHGITNPSMPVCDRLVNTSSEAELPDPRWFVLDDAIASIIPEVRKFAWPLLLPPSSEILARGR